jgi:hypothetical protein
MTSNPSFISFDPTLKKFTFNTYTFTPGSSTSFYVDYTLSDSIAWKSYRLAIIISNDITPTFQTVPFASQATIIDTLFSYALPTVIGTGSRYEYRSPAVQQLQQTPYVSWLIYNTATN